MSGGAGGGGGIRRFVRTARMLLLAQLAAALLALGLAIWAFAAVRGLVAERDRLQVRVQQLEHRPAGEDPVAPRQSAAPEPTDLPITPAPLVIPVPVAVPQDPDLVEPSVPATVTPPVAVEPPVAALPADDCSGGNARQARCRPGRWGRPGRERPDVTDAPKVRPDGNQQGAAIPR